MPNHSKDPATIFGQAVEIESEEKRAEFLDHICAEDGQLRTEVERLISHHFQAGLFLEKSPPQAQMFPGWSADDQLDQEIGPYRIREEIGEGGMGVVYVAEQTEPVQRKVALKVIKPGMDTKEVIARFEAERQALAFMEHPNIARVLDAGATESGRSYFVMELVRGIPITEYCDQVKATPRERLELFQTVCDAVQHAHQKGIIHRDIKPSNVLVTQVGAKPVVKVIDFGLAKATSGQKLTDKTLYTGFMKLMGTPAYMSPEQAGLSGLDVDTRSDVYSLGVLLYELLTGTTPLDKTEIQKQAYEELCRQIREVDAPKPSSRISTLNDLERSSIAQQRQLEPSTLRQLLDGDLDVVVLKAIEKDRDRRYGTPLELAADLDRILKDEPVQAVRPSTLYLARKYMRRHRVSMLTAAAFVTVLILTSAVSTWQAIRATSAEKQAATERNAAVLSEREAQNAKEKALSSEREAQAAKEKALLSEHAALAAKKDAIAAKNATENAKRNADVIAEQRRRELYAANMQLADQLWNSPNGDLKKIEELLTAWIPVDASEDFREFSWRYQWTRLYKGAAVTKLETSGAALSAEGHLLTANNTGIHEWDAPGTHFETRWSGDATKVTFSPDGRWAAIALDGQTQLIEVASGDPLLDIPHALCSFSARSEFLAAWTSEAREAQVWKLSGDAPVATDPLVLPREAMMRTTNWSLQLSDDGRSFLMGGHPTYWQVSMFSGDQQVTWNHRGQAAACVWSPNGEVVVTTSTTGMVHLRLRRLPSNKLTISSHGRYLTELRFSPDGSRMAVGGIDGTIDLWDTSALMELTERNTGYPLGPSGESRGAASTAEQSAVEDLRDPGGTSPSAHDGNNGADASLPSSVRPVLLRSIKAYPSEDRVGVGALVFSADGTKLASYSRTSGGVAQLWDVSRVKGRYEVTEFGEDLFSGRLGLTFEKSDQGVKVASVDSQYLGVVSGEIRVGDRIIEFADGTHGELTDLSNLEEIEFDVLLRGPLRSVVQLTLERENDRRQASLRRVKKEDPRSMRLCFSPDGTTIAIAGQKHGTSTINLATGRTQRFPASLSNSVAISRDNLLATDASTEVLVWDLRRDREHARLDARVSIAPIPTNALAGSLAFSPDGKFLAIGTGYAYNPGRKRSDLKVWRVSDLKEVGGAPVFKHDRVLSDITFTPDSAHFIATCHDGIVRVWNTESWELLDRQFVLGGGSRAIAVSSDGKTLATGCPDQIILWDFTTGEKLRVLSGPSPWALDFSPDGKTLVSGSSNHNVILWDVATGMQLCTFHAHTNAVMGAAFSPDGNTLATAGNEGVLRLWEAASIEELESYPPTLEAMFRLGTLRISEDRYDEAERIFARLLELQQKHLPPGHSDIERTQAEIEKAVEAKRLNTHPPPLNGET